MAKMPLAADLRVIAAIFQRLWQQPFIRGETVAVPLWDDGGLKAVAEGIAPRHQGCSRRRAHWLRVELVELRALVGERIERRRLNVGAAKAEILPAKIVDDDV